MEHEEEAEETADDDEADELEPDDFELALVSSWRILLAELLAKLW